VVCLYVCLSVTFVNRTGKAEPIESRGLTQVGLTNHVLNGVNIGRIRLQRGIVTSRRCGLLPHYFEHLLSLHKRTSDCYTLPQTLQKELFDDSDCEYMLSVSIISISNGHGD